MSTFSNIDVPDSLRDEPNVYNYRLSFYKFSWGMCLVIAFLCVTAVNSNDYLILSPPELKKLSGVHYVDQT